MSQVFVDTLYWVAITSRRDEWHPAAMKAGESLASAHWVTTDEVLAEVLTAFSDSGPILRRKAAMLVRELHCDPTITIQPQSRQTFLEGLAIFEARHDKEYSLTDCVSMFTMRRNGISLVLTHDRHFTQEGFVILLWP